MCVPDRPRVAGVAGAQGRSHDGVLGRWDVTVVSWADGQGWAWRGFGFRLDGGLHRVLFGSIEKRMVIKSTGTLGFAEPSGLKVVEDGLISSCARTTVIELVNVGIQRR
jgi:hypothetical protein